LAICGAAIDAGTVRRRSVHEEVRENLILKLRRGDTLFTGIVGYDDTVIPQLVNALLSQHNFILLGLRGQAKTRLLRALVTLLDERIPADCRLRDQR
jgi:magnesium chelatase subunit I